MPGSGAPVRHVWGAASREIPPAHPNHNLDGFRVLLKTLRGFVFFDQPVFGALVRPPCNNSAGFAPLEALAQPPLETSSESSSGFGCRWRRFSTSLSFGCCWRRLLNLLRKSSSGFCRWRRSLNLCRWRRSLNLLWRALQAAAGDASQPP